MKKLLLLGAVLIALTSTAHATKGLVMPSQFIGTWCDPKNQEINGCFIVTKSELKGFESSCDLINTIRQKPAMNTYFMHFYCEGMDDDGTVLKEIWSRDNNILLMGTRIYRKK